MALKKYDFLHFITFFVLAFSVKVTAGTSLTNPPAWVVGSWKFIGYVYHDEFKPPLNPKLILIFIFNSDSSDSLFWTRQDEPGFCERKGQYSIENDFLNDEVLWLNPKNNRECSQDPDMRTGKKTRNEVKNVDGRLHINLGLAGEPFYFVFEKTSINQKL